MKFFDMKKLKKEFDTFLKKPILVFGVLVLVALYVYFLRIHETLDFQHDTARDTLRALEIIKNRETTLIGPPMSFGQYGTQEVYFGSLALYIGAAGLFVSGMKIFGAVIPLAVFGTFSIPFLYLFLQKVSDNKYAPFIGTLMYTLSPLVVTHTRFFWNANFLLPFGIILWYLFVYGLDVKKWWRSMLVFAGAGLIGGLMTNFHYITIPVVLFMLLYLCMHKKVQAALSFLLGYVITSLPLIIFEARNNMYLTHAFLKNLQEAGGNVVGSLSLTTLTAPILSFLGIQSAEVPFATLHFMPIFSLIIGILIYIIMIMRVKRMDGLHRWMGALFLIMLFIGYALSTDMYYVRYLFPIMPVIVWLLTEAFLQKKKHFQVLLIAVLIPMIFSLYSIVTFKPGLQTSGFVSVLTLEEIGGYIVKDEPKLPYNITENVTSGAQAIPFRYVLTRDTLNNPNDKEAYTGLETLYVISPSEEKIYDDARWEFTATPELTLVNVKEFGDVNLYTFEAHPDIKGKNEIEAEKKKKEESENNDKTSE